MNFDNIIHKLKNVVSINNAVESPRVKMSVCMLGARGVGKTSIITSMYNSQKEAVSGSNLFLVADGDTALILDDKKNELNHIFWGIHEEGSLMTENGIAGDSSESLFKFTYGMNSERINIDLEIRDYPGEYLKKEPQIVADYICNADAVMIAIDTPCLMEESGRYNESKNHPRLVMDFLMNHLSNEEEKLVLFVPLKCERYYIDGRIDEVTNHVKKTYAELLEYLRDRENVHGFKKKICCAVTPIQTLGGVAFDSFEKDDNGRILEIATRDGDVIPRKVNYHYVSADAKYQPKYCVQPLFYLLAFVSKRYQNIQNENRPTGFLAKLRETLRLIPNIEAFTLEIASLGNQRMDGTRGYKVLFGRGRI